MHPVCQYPFFTRLTAGCAPPTLQSIMKNVASISSSTDTSLRYEPGVDFSPPPPWNRIIAYLLDAAACTVLTLSLYRGMKWLLAFPLAEEAFFALTLVTATLFIGILGYWVVIPGAVGATPAKMLFHLRLVSEQPGPLGLDQVMLRELPGHAAMIATAGLGFLAALRDPDGRGFNDRFARTRLVRFDNKEAPIYRTHDLRFEGPHLISGPPGTEPGLPAKSGQHLFSSPDAFPVDSVPTAAPPPSSLYARPAHLTAEQRRLQAARGQTALELAVALRHTAELVNNGRLMPKVLERKRGEFIDRIARIDLGESPARAIEEMLALGRQGILGADELRTIADVLRKRLARSPPQAD
jgi:uncharacterized RDD family membrane protein YckC